MHAKQYLIVVFDLGLVDVPEFQDIGRAVLVLDDGLHGVSPSLSASTASFFVLKLGIA
jgi:hypothetical protein